MSENPWDRFYLLDSTYKHWPWDPWPVKRFRPDALFETAQSLVKQRNEENVDNAIDRVVLLPASGSVAGIHGKTECTDLYSLRSPTKLPVKVHLWMTAQGKIMVRKNLISTQFSDLLKKFEISPCNETLRHYEFWRCISLGPKDLIQLEIPDPLHQAVYNRWQSINLFRFLDLPAELRNMVLSFAMIGHVEPYAQIYQSKLVVKKIHRPNTNLILVSQQLRQEASYILFKQATFSFHEHDQFLRFFGKISKGHRSVVQSIKLYFDWESLLDFFGAQVFHHSPEPGYSMSDYYLTDSLSSDSLRLKHLMIHFPYHCNSCTKLKTLSRRTVNTCIWAAARKYLRDIPQVEFDGSITWAMDMSWQKTLAQERKGILPDPDEFKLWQQQVWKEA